ncbi:hypothetical protein BaRGS_00021279, partial [Batillaria attramentaria]
CWVVSNMQLRKIVRSLCWLRMRGRRICQSAHAKHILRLLYTQLLDSGGLQYT